MGFCLAELAIGFVIPSNDAGLAAMWPSLNAFALTFVIIATLWWQHHKLFASYVVLTDATIVMNFVLLAALALGVYFAQVTVHYIAVNSNILTPARMYMGCMAIVFGLLTTMYAHGVWVRRGALDAGKLRDGVDRTYRGFFGTIVLAGFCAALPALGNNHALLIAAAAVVIGVGVLRRYAVTRLAAYVKGV